MKRAILSLILLPLLLLPLAGCPAVSSTTPAAALAPGYLNSADQQMGQILAGARSFYVTIQQDSAAGKVTLTATEKAAFNDFGTSLNLAETVYLGYHNGSATQAAAQAAINAVQTKQSALPALAVTQ
jgi:hypothetical protein